MIFEEIRVEFPRYIFTKIDDPEKLKFSITLSPRTKLFHLYIFANLRQTFSPTGPEVASKIRWRNVTNSPSI